MKKIISVLIILSLSITTMLAYPFTSYALTTYRTVTKYHLDMGALHIWGTGTDRDQATWQNGYAYGGSMPSTVTLNFGEDIQSAKAYVLDPDAFQWSNYPTYTFNGTDYLSDQESYNSNYADFVSNNITVNKPTVNGKKVTLSYTAKLKSPQDFDLAYRLNKPGGLDYIFDMLGGEGVVEDNYPDLHQRLVDGEMNIGSGVFGYMFFVPIVIEYQVIEPVELNIGEFTADLDVPASAKPGESFNVVDKSAFYDTSEFACTQLSYKVDSGSSKTVTGWKGTSLGESIPQSFANECSVTYTITTWNKYGDSKTASKTINISNDHAIEINPALDLPDYTYEGHKEIAKDESTFVVDGVNYSASRTYAEGLASNNFKADSGTVSIHRLDDTKAECTFSQRGTYDITLNIRADGGGRASTDDLIEVRKTPYIEDSLTGFQKQNRKQILTAKVATYPGKPLTDYSITLKDKKTGESVVLTPGNSQQNTSTIKTRAVTMTQDVDNGYAYITVEFLTKTPSYFSTGTNTQDFYYQIDVTDSKGDTDTASKTFSVSPDLPPVPAISIDPAFLRNEGTNIATIKAEDVTVATDGDSVARKWYYGATTAPSAYTDVSTMYGYQKLSFGTDKIVGFNTVGVGKFVTKLNVKEVWTEPTLEEYVTDADHLTGTVAAFSDVQNVAPLVSLELLNGTEKDVLLIANNDTEYQTLLNNKTALKQALLANKIDANVVIKKLIGDTPSDVTGIQQKILYTFPTTYWTSGVETDRNVMISDSEKTYFTTWTITGGKSYGPPATIHAYNPYAGEVWSYTTNDSEIFSFNQDDTGRYLYLVYSNKTVLLDKKTGAVAGTINTPLTGKLWLTDNLFFSLEGTDLYAIDQNSLIKTKIDSLVYAAARVGSNIQYMTDTDIGVVKNTLNTTSLTTTRELLVDTRNGLGSGYDYIPTCIDSSRKIVLYKSKGTGTDTFAGIRVYSSDNKLIREIPLSLGYRLNNVFAPLDENGECHHIIAWIEDTSDSPNYHGFFGVNLDNGTTASYTKSTDAFNGMGFTVFDSKGTTYMYGAGWYLNGGTYYWGPAYRITYNGSSMSAATSGTGMLGTYDEVFSASDRMVASFWGDNSLVATLKFQISAFPKTLAQETKELLGKFSNKFTFVGGIGTTADQIKAAVDAAQPVVKVSAPNNGSLYLSNLSLVPGQKYYYDYEIKPLTAGTESKINGITATTGSYSSGETFGVDTLYVSESHEENFNDSNIDPFFTVNDPGLIIPDGFSSYYPNCKGYGAYNGDDDDGTFDTGMQLSFTVPAGKQAIVTMDYHMSFTNLGYDSLSNNQYRTASVYDSSNVFVDGETLRDLDTVSSNYETDCIGAMYYKVLGPGTHTVGCGAYDRYDWSYVLIDNLKVDILSTTPKTLSTSFNAEEGDQEGWFSVNGSFEIPSKVLSYGSQTSTTYYGALPAAVTDTTSDRKGRTYPSEITYYQTVPAGYIQKAKAYFSGSVGSGDEVGFFPYNCGEYRYEEKSSFSGTLGIGEWRSVGPLLPGTYSHRVETEDEQSSYARMDTWDIVQYPYNAVTATGNIAFNSTNTEYFFPKTSSTQLTTLNMAIPKGDYLIKNLRIYTIEKGQKVYIQNRALEASSELPNWTLSSGLTASNVTDAKAEKEDDEYVKIYKKGEKVLYNIFYDDYEKDPSKTGYWVYSHIPWPPDTLHPDVGKVLTAPIDRFYLSGKYTVTHWEVDNTQRPGTVGDSTTYNKESNKVTMTFYVDGEGKAPWITYIKTTPATVEYNDSYTIQVGVDDSEKDTLALETSVFLNGVLIKTDNKTGITADANGNYPEQNIAGLPKAAKGTYQVICTVSDYSGTGIKSYKFTVKEVSASATVNATPSLKSGYGISATVKTVTENCTASRVTAVLPSGSTVNMVCTGGSGDNLTWQFPANTGTYANIYNTKHSTVSRQVFVPVKWPDDTYYTITYNVYDNVGTLLAQTTSKTYVNGNMYDDDYTVTSQ